MKLNDQNRYLAYTVIYKMLKADGLHDDHHITHEVINDPGFKEAVSVLERSCLALREVREEEMTGFATMITLDDVDLYTNFQCISEHTMAEEILFGRIISLFFFIYVLCKHLHLEGRQREIESVVDWLTAFLNDKITPWLEQNHGGNWVSVFFMCDVLQYRELIGPSL